MGRPTRRDVLRSALAVALARAASGCGDNAAPLVIAGAVYEATTDALVVSVYASRPTTVIVAATAEATGELAAMAELAIDERGTGALVLGGLAPDTAYTIALATGAIADAPPLRARTAPRDDDPRPVVLAVSADADPIPAFANEIWSALAAHAPELYVSLGDYPYTDDGPDVATTVDAYRIRHAALRTEPAIRAFIAGVGQRAIYDDHEFHNDWDPHFVAADPARYAAAMQVWDEFFPIPGATGDVRYRRWRWGANVECFLLDCRRFRSNNADPDGPAKTMLGATQRAWLIDGVRASTAPFKLVFTTVPLDFGTGDDHWHTFATERDAIFAALVGVPGVLWLSADQHWFAAHRHARGVREIQMGPLARGLGTWDPAVPGVLFRWAGYNFARLDIGPDALVVTGVAADGTSFYTETLTPADLTAT